MRGGRGCKKKRGGLACAAGRCKGISHRPPAAFPPPLRGRVRERGATRGLHHSRNALLLRDNQHPSPALPRKGGGSRAERAATPCVPFSFRKGRRYEEPCTRQDSR